MAEDWNGILYAALRDLRVTEREAGEGLCLGGIPQGRIHGVPQGTEEIDSVISKVESARLT